MPLGTAVGLGTDNIVLDGDPAPLLKNGAEVLSAILGSCVLWPIGWMDEDATCYGSRPRSRPHCIRRSPSSCERGSAAPLFSAYVYCGYGGPSQLVLSSCWYMKSFKILNQQLINLPTSPVGCSHFTKKSFSTILFTHISDYSP